MDEEQTGASEIRVWGPPRCGKTTYVSRQIVRAVEKYGFKGVLVTSFTKAAATELASKNLPLAPGMVGTLHSHCYRALDFPVISETKITDWNRDRPQFRLTPAGGDVDEMEPEFSVVTYGDELFSKLQVLRAKMIPREEWPEQVRRFEAAWAEWKHETRTMDFTDLIETGLREFKIAPDRPSVIVVDEGQDLNRLQLKLVRQWGRHADHILIAGDDDQSIFTFAGASPDVLLERDGEEFFSKVLSQSFRVPRAVHALSHAWIQQVARREPKEYKPRDADGEVAIFHRASYRQVDALVDDAERRIADGKSVMFLASCSYMLEPLRRVLRQRGLPFHNPYRRKRLDWNPLLPGSKGRIAPVDRISAFLKPRDEAESARWTVEDLRHWTVWLDEHGGLVAGAAEALKDMPQLMTVMENQLIELFDPEALTELMRAMLREPLDCYLNWWLKRLLARKKRTAEYLARVAVLHGVPALTDRPRIILGTGHSVKGGEADVVYIFPDLSAAGMRQWEGYRHERDTVIRLSYVMLTRARESVVICEPAGQYHIPLAAAAASIRQCNSVR